MAKRPLTFLISHCDNWLVGERIQLLLTDRSLLFFSELHFKCDIRVKSKINISIADSICWFRILYLLILNSFLALDCCFYLKSETCGQHVSRCKRSRVDCGCLVVFEHFGPAGAFHSFWTLCASRGRVNRCRFSNKFDNFLYILL